MNELTILPSLVDSAAVSIACALKSLCGKPVRVMCIGSDKVVGDSLGPLVGHYLKNLFRTRLPVYGCLDHPINALNLCQTRQLVDACLPKIPILAVDSAIGNTEGAIRVGRGGIEPGSADGKSLGSVGDLHIVAIVSALHPCLTVRHSGIRLGYVNRLAYAIAEGINQYALWLKQAA